MSASLPPRPNAAAEPISPTLDDPDLHDGAEGAGGVAGRHLSHGPGASGRWTMAGVLVGLATLGYLLGYLSKWHCLTQGWSGNGRYTHLCYTDITPLYSLRGFADGYFPYLQTAPGGEGLEYPVLTGMFMWVASVLTPGSGDRASWFFTINVLMLAVCFLVTVVATALTVRHRPWDAALVALAPAGLLTATINWDLLAVALLAVAMLLWARREPMWAGVLLGLAISAKFYPLVILGPWALLCWRANKVREFGTFLLATGSAWLAVNVPFMILNFDGWARFYSFSETRGQDFGSIWLVSSIAGFQVPAGALNTVASLLLLLCCIGIAVLILRAPQRPRLAPMAFLVVAAFLVTNKVYSPQYVLWLIPLAALARPRWRDFMVWQAGQVIYFIAIWLYLAGLDGSYKGLPAGWYAVAILIHIGSTAWFSALLVRDALLPRHDPVRSDGIEADRDDPGGGVLDGAPDREDLIPWPRSGPANPKRPARTH